ncbi:MULTISPECIES: hypothetical protein [Clostridium]|uniref:hypothetical protein n=1 Tax=Clostridium TaxID=1485 RepID=UPI00069F6E17|nr:MULTISPECIES: hypothetical protein [Clostridium]KOF57010.1 hypothetical protein AGR56_10535 [Clostridium sp. DMHC 10]MCD2347526.1 hypothetical protein [Clostridium guangxiense]
MMLDLDASEVKKIKNLINTRIQELRYDMDEEYEDSEEELRNVIRGYKKLLGKIESQVKE